jgi:hypothetical protein
MPGDDHARISSRGLTGGPVPSASPAEAVLARAVSAVSSFRAARRSAARALANSALNCLPHGGGLG